MNAFEFYVFYLALKSHFTSDQYDFVKYHGKVRANPKTFETRRDVFQFKKLAKRKDCREFVLANLLVKPNQWIGAMDEDVYLDWKKRQESLLYIFESDLKYIDSTYTSFNTCIEVLPDLYNAKRISLETITILLDLCSAYKHINHVRADDPLWKKDRLIFKKYVPFLHYDRKRFRSLVLKYWHLNSGSHDDINTKNINNTENTTNTWHSHSKT